MSAPHAQVLKARALAPLLAEQGAEINRRRELTPEVVRALIEGGFFRMLQPRSVGGMELHPSIFAQVTEAISAADGSTAWVVCQGNGCAMSAAYLDPAVALAMFGPSNGILAWGPPGPYEARRVEG
ncbi:MAG: acyl-CoA dehydrogenase family protein, partial [Acetobacteraceae bacterium]|nr:acyl-CoA dehydrogenase family protein [Acetobacteraceae bacterium]